MAERTDFAMVGVSHIAAGKGLNRVRWKVWGGGCESISQDCNGRLSNYHSVRVAFACGVGNVSGQ